VLMTEFAVRGMKEQHRPVRVDSVELPRSQVVAGQKPTLD